MSGMGAMQLERIGWIEKMPRTFLLHASRCNHKNGQAGCGRLDVCSIARNLIWGMENRKLENAIHTPPVSLLTLRLNCQGRLRAAHTRQPDR